ncbi:MAG: hypothetical protein HY673_10980 [Chloroflexi bacterium]|nr:hypothetical protein [Chloroflexota bacterium]
MSQFYVRKIYRNRITIPKEIVERFPGVQYFEVLSKKNEIILRPLRRVDGEDKLVYIRDKVADLGIKRRDIDAAIRRARER